MTDETIPPTLPVPLTPLLDLPPGVLTAATIAACALFILSLAGLAHQETARRGNLLGVIGMVLGAGATVVTLQVEGLAVAATAVVTGSVIGAALAARVAMTSMPQLVAILHSFVGLAAVLVGFASTLAHSDGLTDAERALHDAELYVGVFVGAITFTGSVTAFGKLQGLLRSKPLLLPARHALNLALLVVCGVLFARFVSTSGDDALLALGVMCGIAFFIGWHMVMGIGGADMPVVVSMLNSYSGWAAAAMGFLLGNDLLIVTGALVGSSGAILSYVMCKAMNRSFLSVIFGGFGADEGKAPAPKLDATIEGAAREPTSTTVDEVAQALLAASRVVIVPGYGMATAQAQHATKGIVDALKRKGALVRFAIHPVAGRLPGHMNVLLAEANVSYDIVLEMDEINDDFTSTDVVLVIGANDIVNPSANDDPSSPIAGMPVLHVWEAHTVVVFKRGKGAGYAGIENPLFIKDNTRMLYGDAKKSVEGIRHALEAALDVKASAEIHEPV